MYLSFILKHKLEGEVHYSPYGKGEKTIVWSLLGLSVLLFVGNAVLTVKTYGDMTGKKTHIYRRRNEAKTNVPVVWKYTVA